jgi:hypothetical protein
MEHYRGISFEGASTPIREGLEQVVLAELLSELTPMGWLNQWRIGQHGEDLMTRSIAEPFPSASSSSGCDDLYGASYFDRLQCRGSEFSCY